MGTNPDPLAILRQSEPSPTLAVTADISTPFYHVVGQEQNFKTLLLYMPFLLQLVLFPLLLYAALFFYYKKAIESVIVIGF